MRVPVVRGTIQLPILANYRVDPTVVGRLLPPPFRPKIAAGYSVAARALAVMCLLLLPTSANAQRVSIGAVAGATSTVFVGGCHVCRTVHWESGYGPVLGASASVQLTRTLGLRTEALRIERASRGWTEMRIRYVEFPLLATITPAGRFSGISLLLGASVASERSCRLVEGESYGFPQADAIVQTSSDRREKDCGWHRTNGRNVGYTGGVQYARQVAGGRLELGGRYTAGQSNLQHASLGSWLRTRTSAVTIGYSAAILP